VPAGAAKGVSRMPALHPQLLEALNRLGGPELAARLTAELRGLNTPAVDPQGYEWHATALPTLMSDQVMAPLHFYVQRRQENDGSDSENAMQSRTNGARFVVDLHLSNLGHTQLEGLSKPQHLDLLLRTDTPLPLALQQEISGQFGNILSATGLTGAIAFNRGNWLAFTTPHHSRSI
jgi:hypothetical protein